MQKNHSTISSYHFRWTKTDGLLEVLNEGSYVMAEYSEHTGMVKWHRVVLTAQREKIEKWLREHYPVRATSKRSLNLPSKLLNQPAI